MDLDLSEVSVGPPIVTCTMEAILEPEDVLALIRGDGAAPVGEQPRPAVTEDPSNLKRVREKHHSVARLVATGMTQRLVATITGYQEQYLSVLLNNPAMQELVEMYRMQAGNSAQVIAEKLRTVGTKALEKLGDKLDADEINDVHELAAVAKLGLDRAGHGPTSTSKVVEERHLIDHAEILRMNERAREGSRELIRPLQRGPAALPAPDTDEQAA